jgi:hypothetical protein
MLALRRPRGQRRRRDQPAFLCKIGVEGGRRLIGQRRKPGDLRAGRGQNDARALAPPFAQGKDRPAAPARRQVDFQIHPLGHGKAEAVARQRLDCVAVHRHQPRLKRAGVDPEHGRGGGIDDAQADPPAGIDRDHIWIVQRAVIGQIGVPVVIVQIHGHRGHL